MAELVVGSRFMPCCPSFQMCMASDPSGKTLWLSVSHRRLRPVDDMVLLSCVVGESDLLCSVKLDARRQLKRTMSSTGLKRR